MDTRVNKKGKNISLPEAYILGGGDRQKNKSIFYCLSRLTVKNKNRQII